MMGRTFIRRTIRLRRYLPVPLLVLGLAMPTAVSAKQDGRLTVDEAATQVQERTGGRVLSAEPRRRDGHVVYLIKVLLPDGRVRTFTIDPGTAD